MFWKYFTLLGEIFLFIPAFLLIFFINPNSIYWYGLLNYLVNFFYNYLGFFLTKDQIFILLFYFFCLLAVDFIGSLIKVFFFKPRPNPMEYKNFIEKVLAWSFPSLHSARTFLLVLMALAFTNYYIAWVYFIFWLMIAYSRIYLKKHYWTDIAGGVILAILVFILLYKILI